MTDAEIIKNAPEGATHWDKLQYYRIRFNDSSLNVAWDVFNQVSKSWNTVGDMDVYKIRSLADIRRIVGLEAQLATVKLDVIDSVNELYGIMSSTMKPMSMSECLDQIEQELKEQGE